ncbi:MAG: hypothetical protein QOH48_908 [Actinomycetota bacterium]|nr:hypothetical protein [Actinomycetota bacterium]
MLASLPMTKRRSWVLVAAAIWTVYVWATRIWIIARLSNGTAFKLVHYVLAAISIGFAVAVGWIGVRGLREAPGTESAASSPG